MGNKLYNSWSCDDVRVGSTRIEWNSFDLSRQNEDKLASLIQEDVPDAAGVVSFFMTDTHNQAGTSTDHYRYNKGGALSHTRKESTWRTRARDGPDELKDPTIPHKFLIWNKCSQPEQNTNPIHYNRKMESKSVLIFILLIR